MNRYKCPVCGRNQYTSKDEAEGCIYCGNKELKKMETLEPEVEEECPKKNGKTATHVGYVNIGRY